MSFDSPLGLRHPTVKSLPRLKKILRFGKNTDIFHHKYWQKYWFFTWILTSFLMILLRRNSIIRHPTVKSLPRLEKILKIGENIFSRSYFTPALLMHSNGTRRGMQGCSIFDCGRGDGNFSDPPTPTFFFKFWLMSCTPPPHFLKKKISGWEYFGYLDTPPQHFLLINGEVWVPQPHILDKCHLMHWCIFTFILHPKCSLE